MKNKGGCRGHRLQTIGYEWDSLTIGKKVVDEVISKFINKDNKAKVKFSNGSEVYCSSSNNNCRGRSSKQIWQPFIDENGNGCCTNVLTGETYLDWTKEELEDE